MEWLLAKVGPISTDGPFPVFKTTYSFPRIELETIKKSTFTLSIALYSSPLGSQLMVVQKREQVE
jgi:hypothetical protein